jgi:LacI family transcriptional regulator
VVEALRLRQVDGWISAVATLHDPQLSSPHIPIVLLNRQYEDDTPAVVGDDHDGIVQAVEHLAALGHRRIAYVAGPQTLSTGRARLRAFREVMARHGLAAGPELVRVCESFTEVEGARGLRALLDDWVEFTAVLAGNDLMALGCYGALAERGLSCPAEVSVVGFNDMTFADKFAPPLTSVRIPHHEMGRRAAERLLALIVGDDDAPGLTVLPAQLVVRHSTGPPRVRTGQARLGGP